jgi:hypothetical protein
VQGESRERDSVSTETFAVYRCSDGVPRAQQPGEWTGFVSGVLWEERRGAGRRMASRGEIWSVQRVLYLGGGHGVSWFRPSWIGQRCGAFWTA